MIIVMETGVVRAVLHIEKFKSQGESPAINVSLELLKKRRKNNERN